MYRFITGLCQPYPFLLLLLGGVLLALWWKQREGRRRLLFLVAPYVLLFLISFPPVGSLAMYTLEKDYPPLVQVPTEPEVIVVLGGYLAPPNEQRPEAELGSDSLKRCLYAARLYHAGPPRPVLVSGGKVDPATPGPTLATVMRDFLVKLGVKASDVIVEDQSRTTYENAVESAKRLEQRGLRRVLLVTDAAHLPRSVRCFERLGLEVAPAGCNHQSGNGEGAFADYLPDPQAVLKCQHAAHEWLGRVWYWWHGRI